MKELLIQSIAHVQESSRLSAVEYARSVRPDREAWRESVPQRCMVCWPHGTNDWPLEVHEIERRSHGVRRWGHRSNYLLVDRICHAGPIASMPHAQQLAIKLLCDPEHFNLDAWLRISDPQLKAPDRVTWSDIVAFLKLRDVA